MQPALTMPTAPETPEQSAGWLLRASLLLIGFAVIGTVIKMIPAFSPETLGQWLGHGPKAVAGFVVIGAIVCAAGLPRQTLAFSGAYLFGLLDGLSISMVAQLVGCGIGFAWAHFAGGAWARKKFLRGRLAKTHAFLTTRPFTATLILRLLPVGSNVVLNTLAGISGIRFAPFLAATVIGYAPQTIVFALLGSGIQVGRGWRVAMAVALFVLSGLLGWRLMRSYRQELPKSATDAPLMKMDRSL